jgi:peptidoglycan/LPS O-acetylase OafA/YrhL
LAAILVLPYVGAEPYFLAFQNGQDTDGLRPILADLGTALAVIAFFTAALLGAPLLRPFLRSRVLAFVGLISYSLFLLHGTVLVISSGRVAAQASALGGEGLLTDWGGFLAFAIAMFAVSGVLAYLSYRFVESPFLRRKPR